MGLAFIVAHDPSFHWLQVEAAAVLVRGPSCLIVPLEIGDVSGGCIVDVCSGAVV